MRDLFANQHTHCSRVLVFCSIIWTCPVVVGQVVDIPTSPLNDNAALVQQTQIPAQPLQAVPQPLPADAQPLLDDPLAFPPDPQPLPEAQQSPSTQPELAPAQSAPQPVPQQAAPQQTPSPIDQLQQPIQPQPFTPPSANLASSLPQNLGAAPGSFAASPTMIGDFFGGGFSGFFGSQTVTFSGYSPGEILSGVPGGANSTLAFEFGTDAAPNDIFTTGVGQDLAGADGGADTFAILEPVPPTDAPTAPAPGFLFDGGTAVYTNNLVDTTPQPGIYTNGEQWFIQYSYTATIGGPDTPGQAFIPVPAPGVATRRVKISENFSPDVRDRCFATYSFFNDAFAGLGDVSRYIIGFERILFEELVSFETRVPMAGTYGSTQVIEGPQDRDFELGNAVFLLKGVLLRADAWLWTGGLGVGVPFADDTRVRAGNRDVVVIKNGTTHILPFTAFMYRPNRDWAFQGYLQLDVATGGDDVLVNLLGGPLDNIGTFNDSTLLHLDVAAICSLYRDRCAPKLKEVLLNAELHYTGTVEDSDLVSDDNFTYTNLKNSFNIVNATTGLHFVMANGLVVSPAMSVPLRDGLDEQFDYEALVQINYFR